MSMRVMPAPATSPAGLFTPPRTTSDLAQCVKDQAARLPQKNEQIKGLEKTLTLIQVRQLQSPTVDPQLQTINKIMQRFENEEKMRPSLMRKLLWTKTSNRRQRRELEEAVRTLEMMHDIQCATTIDRLQTKAAPISDRYSNADLARLFDKNFDGWSPSQPIIYVTKRNTTVDIGLKNQEDDEIRVHLSLSDNFPAACNELGAYFGYLSRPVDDTFLQESAKNGEIKLTTKPEASNTIVLWVYHNVFVRIELLPFEQNAPVLSSRFKSLQKSFVSLADHLFDYIRDGSVATKNEATLPNIFAAQSRAVAEVGNTFDIEINVDIKHYYDVEYDDNKLVYAKSEQTDEGRKYMFLATQTGEVNISFNFAHHSTFNSKSIDLNILIK